MEPITPHTKLSELKARWVKEASDLVPQAMLLSVAQSMRVEGYELVPSELIRIVHESLIKK